MNRYAYDDTIDCVKAPPERWKFKISVFLMWTQKFVTSRCIYIYSVALPLHSLFIVISSYYVNGSRLILTQILPVASLVYFNTAIFRGIKYVDKYSRRESDFLICPPWCRYAHVRSNRNSSSHNEVNLATVLICIVIMFLLCHFPRLIINVAEFIINRTFRWAVAVVMLWSWYNIKV